MVLFGLDWPMCSTSCDAGLLFLVADPIDRRGGGGCVRGAVSNDVSGGLGM